MLGRGANILGISTSSSPENDSREGKRNGREHQQLSDTKQSFHQQQRYKDKELKFEREFCNSSSNETLTSGTETLNRRMMIVRDGILCRGNNSRCLVTLFFVVMAWVLAMAPHAWALPPGFRDEGVVSEKQSVGFNFVPSPLPSSTNSEWLLLTTRKKGQVVAVLDPDAGEASPKAVILDIEDHVCSQGERGVFQVLPHPSFATNRYVYVFYTYDMHGGCKFSPTEGPVNAVARFTMVGTNPSTLRLTDEEIIFVSNPLPSKVHNGGDMKFGHDGNLYITLGNGGMSNEHNNAQRSHTLLGSIVRITDSGEIPWDNPFQGPNDRRCGQEGLILSEGQRCSEIFATGFRNPFRFALDPNAAATNGETRFYVNDVGGSSFEEVNLLTANDGGKNYGYREREGPCKRMTTDCGPTPAEYVDPIYWYEHVNRTDACLTGGAFVPDGIWSGASLGGKYLFADFVFRTISLLTPDPAAACPTCSPPTPGFTGEAFADLQDIGQPTQLTFGPYKGSQALYYSLWAPDSEFSIRRIIFEGPNSVVNDNNGIGQTVPDNSGVLEEEKETGVVTEVVTTPVRQDGIPVSGGSSTSTTTNKKNSSPDAEVRIKGPGDDRAYDPKKNQNYGIGDALVFDATKSFDPDGDALIYSWNFGDGTGSTQAVQSHTYWKAGEYRVKLTVQDPYGFTNHISRLITIGDAPVPEILSPFLGHEFAVGDTLTLYGYAVDGSGNVIEEESDLTWEVRQIHNTHYHPFLDPTPGNWIEIPPAPSPEDFLASTNSFLRIILTATDPVTGLSGTVTRDVLPKTKTLYFDTDPPGLELTLDGYDIRTPNETGIPLEVITWIHHNLTIDVKDQDDMLFESWNDGSRKRFYNSVIEDDEEDASDASIRIAKFVRTATEEKEEPATSSGGSNGWIHQEDRLGEVVQDQWGEPSDALFDTPNGNLIEDLEANIAATSTSASAALRPMSWTAVVVAAVTSLFSFAI